MISKARPSSPDARIASVPSTTYDPCPRAPDQIPSNAYHARSQGVGFVVSPAGEEGAVSDGLAVHPDHHLAQLGARVDRVGQISDHLHFALDPRTLADHGFHVTSGGQFQLLVPAIRHLDPGIPLALLYEHRAVVGGEAMLQESPRVIESLLVAQGHRHVRLVALRRRGDQARPGAQRVARLHARRGRIGESAARWLVVASSTDRPPGRTGAAGTTREAVRPDPPVPVDVAKAAQDSRFLHG